MSDLTIRTPQGSWLNICDSEWYTRNEDNTEWLRLNPHEQEIRVRHGSNAYWLDVTCNRDSFYCPVDATADCWPGFTGNFDGGYIVGGGPTNYYITNCEEGADLKRKTYSGMTNNFDVVGGNFNVTSEYSNGYTLPLSWAGGRAEVNEILLNPGSESGQIFVEFDDMGDSSLRFRVYQNCKLLGDSKQYGNTFSVFYTEGEGPVFLRVDSLRPNARWFVRASAVNVDILSSINARAACFGTFGARMRCMIDGDVYYQGVQAYEAVHEIYMHGTMRIDYDFAETPSNIRVFYGQEEVAFALDVVGKGSLAFAPNFNPIDRNLVVRIESQPFNNTWSYSIYCADTCGALANKCIPMEIEESPTCTGVFLPTDTIKSAGAPQTTINVDYSHAESGKVYISYVASSEVQFIVYKDGEVIAGSQPNKGKQVFAFRVDLDRGSNFITVVVVGPCCPQWEFTITDSVPEPDITIADASVVRPGKGDIAELCFPVTLSHRFDEPVYIDYATQQQTAYESIANMSLDYTPKVLIGSNVVVASVVEYGSAKVIFDGGIARFTNSALSAVNRAYLENVQTWFSDSGSRTLIINTTTAGAEYSIGAGVSQIPNIHNADVLHYAGSPIAVSVEAMLEYDIVYLFATNHSVNQGFANSRLSTETYNAIVTFADSGKSLFIGTVNGAYASAMNIFTQYFGTQARGSYTPTNVAGNSLAANYGPHVVRDSLGTFTFPGGAAGLTLTNIKRQAVAQDFCVSFVHGPTEVVQLVPTDYRRTEGTLRIEPCGLEGEICVPVCGSNLVGPDVTFLMKLVGSNVGFIERPAAVGTIINKNVAACDQNTLIAVKQDIPNPYVRNGALDIFCNQKSANIDFSAVMERDLTLPVSGTYKFIFYGRDVAELFVDCDMIVRSAGGTTAVEAATFLYEGTKKLYITYYVAGGKTRKPAYAALAIINPLGQVMYASSANGWRGRVINEGTPPYCRQYLGPCDFRATHGVAVANSSNDTNIGYSALRIRSTAHSDNCAAGGQHYLMRKTINLPAGSYVIRGTSDDYMYVYLDCVLILSTANNWKGVYAAGFNVAQSGNHELTVDYINVPHCTPGWVKFVILNAQNQVVYSTHPDGWVSTYDSIPQGLYQSTWGGGTVLHISTSQGSGGPNYAWWSAERAINIPETGLYYVVSVADDDANLYIGCQLVATFSSFSQGWRASPMFELYEGDQYMALRCYNQKGDNPNFAGFRLYKADGTLIYTSTAAGWLGSRRDLDFSGMG